MNLTQACLLRTTKRAAAAAAPRALPNGAASGEEVASLVTRQRGILPSREHKFPLKVLFSSFSSFSVLVKEEERPPLPIDTEAASAIHLRAFSERSGRRGRADGEKVMEESERRNGRQKEADVL